MRHFIEKYDNQFEMIEVQTGTSQNGYTRLNLNDTTLLHNAHSVSPDVGTPAVLFAAAKQQDQPAGVLKRLTIDVNIWTNPKPDKTFFLIAPV